MPPLRRTWQELDCTFVERKEARNTAGGVGGGSTWNDIRIVTVQEELQTDLVHLVLLGERERLSNKTSQTLAQGVVPALHMHQLSAFLAHRLMALLRDDRPISLPEIAVAIPTFIAFGNPLPQPPTSSLAALTDNVGDHLTSVAPQGDPYPAFVGFLADKRPQLVEFEHELFGRWGGQQGSRQRRQSKSFFEPARDGVARHSEGARETPERGAFLVSAQDLLASLRWIGIGAWVLAALAVAIMAEILLFAVGSLAVLDDVFAVAVVAGDNLNAWCELSLED